MTAPDAIMTVQGLDKSFGGVQALADVAFDVGRSRITALIGPNGAGKTTCLNVISGVYALTGGRIEFDGRDITGLKPYRIAGLGLTRTFQNLQVFHNMTVLENVMVGLHTRSSCEFISALFHPPRLRREERTIRETSRAVLEFFGLADRADWPSAALSYGDQKRVEMARALVSRPKLLLLDEPAAGLNTRETEGMAELIQTIQGQGVTILLVEHDMDLVMGVSNQVVVLNHGQVIAVGAPREVQEDPEVVAAYLGGEGADHA